MSDRNNEWELLGQQEKAAALLSHSVDELSTSPDELAREAQLVTIESELQRKGRLVQRPVPSRTQARLLIVSSNVALLDEASTIHHFYKDLAGEFDEIHIVVTASLRQSRHLTKRVAKNIWLYTTGHAQQHQIPSALKRVAQDQLTFTGGFRPDLIVATDPYETGLAAYWLAQEYSRPFQVHVMEAFWSATWQPDNRWRSWRQRLARYVLNRTKSVRTGSNDITRQLQADFPDLVDVALLPQPHKLEPQAVSTEPQADLYPQYSLTLMFIGELNHESTLWRTLDIARNVLQSPRAGLIVVGAGAAQNEFAERAKILGVAEQVQFIAPTEDIIPQLKSADVLLVTDVTEASDELVLLAAQAGTPMLLAETPLRAELFTDGQDAFLCAPEDVPGFSQKLNKFLNTSSLRKQFSTNVRSIVADRLHTDPVALRRSFRLSLEAVFGVYQNDPIPLAVGDSESEPEPVPDEGNQIPTAVV